MHRSRPIALAAGVLSATLVGCNPQLADDKPAASTPTSTASAASPAPGGRPGPGAGALGLTDANTAIPDSDERRDGYERDAFRLWIDEDDDGCQTRAEVLLQEATTKPEQGERCTLWGRLDVVLRRDRGYRPEEARHRPRRSAR